MTRSTKRPNPDAVHRVQRAASALMEIQSIMRGPSAAQWPATDPRDDFPEPFHFTDEDRAAIHQAAQRQLSDETVRDLERAGDDARAHRESVLKEVVLSPAEARKRMASIKRLAAQLHATVESLDS